MNTAAFDRRPSAEPTPRARALVVDDDPDHRALLATVLRRVRVEAVTAASATEALNLLGDHNEFDLLLVDLRMPGVDGYELIDRLRRRPDTRRVPTVVITAVPLEEVAIGRLVGGASWVIEKGRLDLAQLRRQLDPIVTIATASAMAWNRTERHLGSTRGGND